MSGSSGTGNTQYSYESAYQAAPEWGRTLQAALAKQLGGQTGTGMTDQQLQQATGNMVQGVGEQTTSSLQTLKDTLARSGVTGGAAAEGASNIERGGVESMAKGLSGITGQNIAQNQTNIQNAMNAFKSIFAPLATGSSSTTTQQPGLLQTLGMII